MIWKTSRNKPKKVFCYQKLFWPFTVRTNCSSDLKIFANSRPSASNFKSFSWSLEHFFLTVGQNNFGNKISFLHWRMCTATKSSFSPDVRKKIEAWRHWCKTKTAILFKNFYEKEFAMFHQIKIDTKHQLRSVDQLNI